MFCLHVFLFLVFVCRLASMREREKIINIIPISHRRTQKFNGQILIVAKSATDFPICTHAQRAAEESWAVRHIYCELWVVRKKEKEQNRFGQGMHEVKTFFCIFSQLVCVSQSVLLVRHMLFLVLHLFGVAGAAPCDDPAQCTRHCAVHVLCYTAALALRFFSLWYAIVTY